MARSRGALAALALVALTAGCGGPVVVEPATSDSTTTTSAPGPGALSIVQLGDSIASGEGTLYGYDYDAHSQEWTGGNLDVVWPGPYPLCHDSPDAYGSIVAGYFDADFHQFACTGATFAAGISAAETDRGTVMRPAQFGNWATQAELNADYDAAEPDVVLVTLGADDLQFVSIVEACIENGYEYAFDLVALACTSANPGSTIQRDYFDFLPTLQANYATLVDWIAERAKAKGVAAPKVVITNYANPLPADGAKCPDTSWLYPEQTEYLASLVDELNGTIRETVEDLGPDVGFADISTAYEPQGVSHIWCTDAPWAYGLSIYKVTEPDSFESQAPFHPTPQGQDSIAAHVIPVVRQLLGG